MRLYTIWDKAACESCTPFEAKNDTIAKRQLDSAIAKTRYKNDYELYFLGEYVADTMVIIKSDEPVKVELDINSEVENG